MNNLNDWYVWLYSIDVFACLFLYFTSIQAGNKIAIYGWACALMLSLKLLAENLSS